MFLKILRVWLIDPSTPEPHMKNHTITGNNAVSHYFDQFEHLQRYEDSDIPFLTTYSESELNSFSKTQTRPSLKLLFTAFNRAHWFDFSGQYIWTRPNLQKY